MEIDFKEYQLRCELRGHEDDVRGICVCGNEGMATSSRDRTVRFWSPDHSDKRKFVSLKILLGHSSFVGPLAWISPKEEYPEGGIVSGGMDTLVLVWDLRTGEKVQTLKGHPLQVTGIALDDGDIVSSSADWRSAAKIVDYHTGKQLRAKGGTLTHKESQFRSNFLLQEKTAECSPLMPLFMVITTLFLICSLPKLPS